MCGIIRILLPSQVNQEVPPQYPASRRISSPLTTSKRAPYLLTSVRRFCYTFRPARGSANFCHSCRSRSATCNFSGRGHFCPRASQYYQYIHSSRTVRFRGPGLLCRYTTPCSGGDSKQSEPISFFHMLMPLLQLSQTPLQAFPP